MNTPQDCCAPCPTTQTVNVPGVAGNTGSAGTNGVNGVNAFSFLSSDLTVPPDLVTPVTITVSSTLWMVVGMDIKIGQGAGLVLTNPGPGTFIITAIPSPSTVTLLYLNESGDVGFGGTISAGAVVAAAGVSGISLPIAIAQGGTGATNKAAAQAALGLGQPIISSKNTGLTQAIVNPAVQIGSIDITLTDVGTWMYLATVAIDQIGATFAANRTVTFRVRNITQGYDIATRTIHTQTATTLDRPTEVYVLIGTDLIGAVNDHIQTFIGIDTANTAGTYQVIEANLFAVPISKS